MANASAHLVSALRQTAARLRRTEVKYKWSSFARCNCGHLAQTLTGLTPADLAARATKRSGDWRSQALEVAREGGFPQPDFGDRPALDEGAWEPENVGACTVTGERLDEVFGLLHAHGLNAADIGHLERLTDPRVRRELNAQTQDYPHYKRDNVIAYLEAWADLLERQLRTDGALPTESLDVSADVPMAAE